MLPELYAVAVTETPVWSSDPVNIYGGEDGSSLHINSNGLVKELEFVAYPGTIFRITNEKKLSGHYILTVECDEYDVILGGTKLYIDSRFVKISEKKPGDRKKTLPSIEKIYEYLDNAVGARYVWGANNINGVSKMTEFYPPPEQISLELYHHWIIKGVDCSGLIYEATNGYTPRNTFQLVNYGQPLIVENERSEQIIRSLKPLDLIAWKGHVLMVYDNLSVIESAHIHDGVIKHNINDALERIMVDRKPVNEWNDDNADEIFVIRRWFKG